MLAVGARLTEDDGAGGVVDALAEAVDVLSVGLHVELLEVGREAAESLGVGQDRRGGVAQDVALVHTDEGVEQGGVLEDVGLLRGQVLGVRAVEEASEDLGAEGQGQHHAAHAGAGGVASADVVIHEEGGEIVAGLGQGRGLARDGDHVLCRVKARIFEGVLDKALVGQGLERRAGLGNQHKQGVLEVDGLEHACRVVGVDV